MPPKKRRILKNLPIREISNLFRHLRPKKLTLAALGGRNTGNLNAILYILSTRNKLVSEHGITKTDLISLNQVLINFTQ